MAIKKLTDFGKDTSAIWKNIKNWLGWTSGGPPTKLLSNGKMFSKPSDLANIMNSFFINKVKNLRENLPTNVKDPLLLPKKLMKSRNCNFILKSVHPDDIKKMIANLKNSKSCGSDNIDTYVLKLAQDELTPVITHIVNLSIEQKVFPSQWKTAKVIPLHKKEEKIYPKNFRPVSLLCIFSKILERAVFAQVVDYLESNNLLHPSHHGFRSKHNTTTALAQMFEVWLEAFDDNEISAVILLDMSAAFDVVDHNILLKKLAIYGFDTNLVDWMTSYLSNRKQSVYIDGAFSDFLAIEAGVPQGSILGPLLYVIFTNDLPEVVHNHLSTNNTFYNTHCAQCGGLCCYADDSTYTFSGSDIEEVKDKMHESYENLSNYMSENKLVLNSDKTHVLVMASSKKHKKYKNFGIFLDTGAEIIEPVENEKLLGCHVSNDFRWNNHIRDNEKSMLKILTSKINALKKISYYSSFKTRKMIAQGIIMSNLTYLIQLYGGSSEYLLSLLQVVQNSAARLVTKLPWSTPTSTLLLQCGWLNIRQLVKFHSLVLLFKIKHDKKPTYLSDKISDNFGYKTRLATSNGIRKNTMISTEVAKKSFLNRTTQIWNKMPPNLRSITSIVLFKKKMKVWVRD